MSKLLYNRILLSVPYSLSKEEQEEGAEYTNCQYDRVLTFR